MKTRCEDDPTYAHRHSTEYAVAMLLFFIAAAMGLVGLVIGAQTVWGWLF